MVNLPDSHPAESVSGGLFKRRDAIWKRASECLVDALIGYPQLTQCHQEALQIAIEALTLATENFSELNENRKQELDALTRFFGYNPDDGPTFFLPSAMEAVGSVINRLSEPNSAILLLNPAYEAFEELVRHAGNGDRKAIHVDCTKDPEIAKIKQAIEVQKESSPVTLIVVNTPRNPDMYIYNECFLSELASLADKEGITILYDEVFLLIDPRTSLKKVVTTDKDEENHISSTIPRSKSSVVIRDTGKVLPEPFPKVAAIQVSNEALPKGGQLFLDYEYRSHFNYPPAVDLHTLVKVLHSDQLPHIIKGLQELNLQNFAYLETTINLPIEHCGPFALIDLSRYVVHSLVANIEIASAIKAGRISAQLVSNYYPPDGPFPLGEFAIRLPLTMDNESFKKVVVHLEESLKIMQEARDIEPALEVIGWGSD